MIFDDYVNATTTEQSHSETHINAWRTGIVFGLSSARIFSVLPYADRVSEVQHREVRCGNPHPVQPMNVQCRALQLRPDQQDHRRSHVSLHRTVPRFR